MTTPFLSPDVCEELKFIHRSCCTVGYRPNVFSTTLSHLAATNSAQLIMPFVPIREMLKEKVEECFDCQFELVVEFTGLIRTRDRINLKKEGNHTSTVDSVEFGAWAGDLDELEFGAFASFSLSLFKTSAVIDAEIIPRLIYLFEFEIIKEVALALSNAAYGGSRDQIKYLVTQGCIKPLCYLLECFDLRIVSVCLEGLENILKIAESEKNLGDVNGYAQIHEQIHEAEGLEKIKNLQSRAKHIYKKAVKILKTYWLMEEDEVLPPRDAFQQQTFQFGGHRGAQFN